MCDPISPAHLAELFRRLGSAQWEGAPESWSAVEEALELRWCGESVHNVAYAWDLPYEVTYFPTSPIAAWLEVPVCYEFPPDLWDQPSIDALVEKYERCYQTVVSAAQERLGPPVSRYNYDETPEGSEAYGPADRAATWELVGARLSIRLELGGEEVFGVRLIVECSA